MNKMTFKSIRTSLLFLVLLIFIPLLAIVFHSAWQYRLSSQRFVTENALRAARNLAEQQKLIESNTRQFLTVLSQMPVIKSGDTSQINKILHSFLISNPSYASLLMVNTNGDMIASGLQYVNLNVKDRKYFTDAMNTKSFAVGEYTRGRLTRKPVIHYACPVFGKDSSIQSILVVSFDLKFYDGVFKKSELGDDASFTFTDHRGVILYQSENQAKNVGLSETDAILDKIKEKEESTFVLKNNDGIKKLYGYECVTLNSDKPYMFIYVSIPEKVAYAEFRKILSYNVILWILGVVLIITSAYFFSIRYIIKPIDKLAQTTKVIAEGKLDTRTGLADDDTEIGKLAKAIDEMTDDLFRREMEQKKTQKDLRRLKERFELAINSAHIGIWDWHIRNNTLLWDRNMFNLYEIKHEEFDFRYESWMMLIHPEDRPCLDQLIKDAIRDFVPFRSEFRITHPIAGTKSIRIFANVIPDKEGNPVRLIGVNWDITERKNLEQKLHDAKNKAETSDKLKSSFLANISHEIRTPLHGIIGFAQILKQNELSEADRSQYLGIIVESGNKLMDIISNIIDISMLDADQLKIQPHECELTALVNDVYVKYETIKAEKNLGFDFILEPEVQNPFTVYIDDSRFKQILSNLLDNAFKFTTSGEIRIGYRIFNGELLCYVKDTGIGINRENLLKIFERFKQLDENNNRLYNGNGIGLAICRGLLELMEGKIWAVSKESGSEFYFSLPLKSLEFKQLAESEDTLFA
jgi:Signal transduction histidine kinase